MTGEDSVIKKGKKEEIGKLFFSADHFINFFFECTDGNKSAYDYLPALADTGKDLTSF